MKMNLYVANIDSFKIKKTRTTGNMGGNFKGMKLFIVNLSYHSIIRHMKVKK